MKRKVREIEIDIACPHTIKKFELIEEYVKAWAPKLLRYPNCSTIVFIDCMCNSGIYLDDEGNDIQGTPIRVAKYLSGLMSSYSNKRAYLYFNDLSADKIEELKLHLPQDSDNFTILTNIGDANDLLGEIAKQLKDFRSPNYLLVYDPYTASIDWSALEPFIKNWGEIIINHMVSDSIRGISQAKRDVVKNKYEQTYLSNIEDLLAFGSDKVAFEKRVQEIIAALRGPGNKRYYIATFPFFNRQNVLVYNLIHCTGSIYGFRLYKTTAWKVFGGKSSAKNTHGVENQLQLDFNGVGGVIDVADEYCYYVKDIVKYLHNKFCGMSSVAVNDIWEALDEHPVFPSDGYRREIKLGLREIYKDSIGQQTISFSDRI